MKIDDGSYLDCTKDHKFSVNNRFEKSWNKVEAKDLMDYSIYNTRFENTKIERPNNGINYIF